MGSPPTHTVQEDKLNELDGGPPSWSLKVLHSPDAAVLRREVEVGPRMCLGRVSGADVDLAIADGKISKRHATVAKNALTGAFELEDHDSRNGSFVNGARRKHCALVDGSIIRVGDTLLEFGRWRPGVEHPDRVLIGDSFRLRAILDEIERVARSFVAVLVLGETGTGKDVVARRIHDSSGRTGPYVAVNCAALPADLVESALFGHRRGAFTGATSDAQGFFGDAQGGTLFLDEVGELPLRQQSKLLRVLENREYTPVGSTKIVKTDTRIIAATNADLESEAAAGTFRNDLFARLAGVQMNLPPLRARKADIPLLVRSFLAEIAPSKNIVFGVNAMERLLAHSWPRNVRELRTVVQRVALLFQEGGEVSPRELDQVMGAPKEFEKAAPPPPVIPVSAEPRPDRFWRPPRDELIAHLTRHGGNISRLAEHYGKDSKQVYRWLKHYGIALDSFRP